MMSFQWLHPQQIQTALLGNQNLTDEHSAEYQYRAIMEPIKQHSN